VPFLGCAVRGRRYLEADIAAFLLMRGPWAWVGAGVWGMSWPVGITFDSNGTAVPRPPAMDTDYGVPVDATYVRAGGALGAQVCREVWTCVSAAPGLFVVAGAPRRARAPGCLSVGGPRPRSPLTATRTRATSP
jgi:hypothetical protein